VIRINDEQLWLYAAADPVTKDLPHGRLFATTTTALTELFLRELREKHDVEAADFLVDVRTISKLLCNEPGSDFRCVATEIGLLSNACFKNSNAERRRFRTASVTSTQRQPNHGSKPSLAGTMPLTEHDRWLSPHPLVLRDDLLLVELGYGHLTYQTGGF
jgi:transposase-like protein